MRVGVLQSCYIPWRGFFDFISSVDLWIFYDDVQYSKGSWRNRNKVKTPSGLKWITVPVKAALDLTIDRVQLGQTSPPWIQTHDRQLSAALGNAPFFGDAISLWREGVSHNDLTISQLNIRLIKLVCSYLGINTPMKLSREYAVEGARTERLVALLKRVGASTYLSGPSAMQYLDKAQFRDNKIALEIKTYDYPAYPQLWGEFANAVTVLDLIANTGPKAREWIQNRSPNTVVAV